MIGAAAFVRNAHLDIFAANALARALHAEALDSDEQPPSLARFVFRPPPDGPTTAGRASPTTRSAG
ncbi:hypothetical protein [Streptomyces sp. GbtcB6]|uniref:MmyB family transcriptional regulator n=1 Tax=Streptomyces sp. GbtcB6 TaxID=2824751 RepID=UPI001C30F2B6